MSETEATRTETKPGTRSGPAGRAGIALAIFLVMFLAVIFVFPDEMYLWAKALHVVAVISWMAGMLYLPRLFVYHTQVERGSLQSETFKMMEQRLLRVIVNPAMTVTWVLGLWLAWTGFSFSGGWLHAKFALVLAMSGLHGHFSKAVRLFSEDRNEKSTRYWRFMNEAPTLLMIVIVILVVVKPF